MITATINELLNNALYWISQSLLTPVLVVLLIFFLYALLNLGSLLYEYKHRMKVRFDGNFVKNLILSLSKQGSPEKIIQFVESSEILENHKKVLVNIAETSKLSPKSRESLAIKLIEDEENRNAKKLEKTDIIAKIAPAVGLMGTLIPLGPGLAALGAGDIQSLSQHMIIAFGAAVIGMAAAAIGFTISKIRRRWYGEEISALETLAESALESL